MRIDKKWFKKHQHRHHLSIPSVVRKRFAKEIASGDVPSSAQIRAAVNLGVVKKVDSGGLDPQSLTKYFETFIRQRRAEERRS